MIREIYLKDEEDSTFKRNKLEEISDKEILLNKIKMILFTNKGDVLGEPNLGMDLESYLFEKNVPTSFIEDKFYDQLNYYVRDNSEYTITIQVALVDLTVEKMLNITIKLNDKTEINAIIT